MWWLDTTCFTTAVDHSPVKSSLAGVKVFKVSQLLCPEPRPPDKIVDKFLWISKVLITFCISEYDLVKDNCSHFVVLILMSDWII